MLSPLLVLIALAIKVKSPGPVLYTQERSGLNGRCFQVYKFRTMVMDADKIWDDLQEENEADGPAFKIKKPLSGLCGGNFKKGEGEQEKPCPRHEKKVTPAPAGIHQDVKRLYTLIEKAPVEIYAVPGHTKINIKPWFEKNNKEKCCEISALVFSDYCGRYLVDHPAEVIDKGNFWGSLAE